MKNCFYLLIVSLFIFASIGSAQNVSPQDKQNLACSSINNLPLSKGAKSLLLSHCTGYATRAVAGSKFTASSSGDFFAVSDNTADFGNCGHPNHDFYFEAGFQKYSDSEGGRFDGPYVFVFFRDFDCNGNFVGEASCFTGVPAGVVQLTPFETASVLADLDIECTSGATMHLTTNIAVTADGFANYDKNKNVVKRETFNETNDYSQKYRSTTSVGEVILDGYSYDLSQNGILGKYKSKFSHKDL